MLAQAVALDWGYWPARPPLRISAPRRSSDVGTSAEVIALPASGSATIHKALADLRRYKRYQQLWDGWRAHSARPKSFELAESFLAIVATSGVPFEVHAQIFVTGSAVLTVTNTNVDAQLEFLDDGVIAANVDTSTEKWDSDVAGFDGKSIPAQIAERLGIHT